MKNWTHEQWVSHHMRGLEALPGSSPAERELWAGHYVAALLRHWMQKRGDMTIEDVRRVIAAYGKHVDNVGGNL